MHKQLELYGCQVEVDVERTRDEAAVRDERCTCDWCRNYYAQLDSVFPPEFLELLSQLGIDFRNETRLSNCGKHGGLQLYLGEFWFVGRVKPKGDVMNRLRSLLRLSPKWYGTELNGHFSFSFNRFAPTPDGKANSPQSYISYAVRLPWVLDEPEPDSP